MVGRWFLAEDHHVLGSQGRGYHWSLLSLNCTAAPGLHPEAADSTLRDICAFWTHAPIFSTTVGWPASALLAWWLYDLLLETCGDHGKADLVFQGRVYGHTEEDACILPDCLADKLTSRVDSAESEPLAALD